MKKLPIGVYTFSKMIEEDHLYVDKTQHILTLIDSGKYYFLSRPRRFGKSLLVSTLKEIFSGHKELFQGLFIYDKIEWTPYPVVHLDCSRIDHASPEALQHGLLDFLHGINESHALQIKPSGFRWYFTSILEALAAKYGQRVVVLIDEYDKPIIDHTDDLPTAKANRKILKDFYGALKAGDAHLQFVLLTGVSKFSQVSVFSDLNNLNDISIFSKYASLLGYTQTELEHYFTEYLQQFSAVKNIPMDDLLRRIKRWYNGYSWDGEQTVYNPFSILNLFEKQQFNDYWFATGTPTFLLEQIKQSDVATTEFENKQVSGLVFDSYDLERMNVFALLFQAGYLTITDVHEDEDGVLYTLNYPNLEVKNAFLTHLLESLSSQRLDEIHTTVRTLKQHLHNGDVDEFINIVQALFAKIPYTLHIEKEAYYHSLFYMIAALMGVDIELEVLTDKGRIDGVLECEDKIYIIEFKYGRPGSDSDTLAQNAIQQIRKKQYAERYQNDARPRVLLGIGFTGKEIGYQLVENE